MQQSIGEHVATIGVGAQLDFIDGDEFHRAVTERYRERAGADEPPARDTPAGESE